jgi:autotransporter-associated beta strand protein
MSKKLNTLFSAWVAFAGLLVSSTPSAMAVNFIWDNTGTTWNGTSSWVGDVAPASNSSSNPDTVQFGNMAPDFNSVFLASNRTVAGATFDAGANAYTFTTDAVIPLRLAIGLSGIANNSTATQTFNLGVDVTQATSTWQSVAGGSLIFNNGIGLSTSGSSRTLTVAGAGNFTVNQAIVNGGSSSAGVVTVTSTGTTTFSGNNTYDGLTTMNAAGGTLTLSGDNSGAAGGVTLTAGTLNINNNNALGTGALSLAGAGATINNTSGAAVVNARNQAWTLNEGLAFGSSTNTAANNLNLGTGVVTASSSRTIALAGSGTKLTIGAVNITSTASGRTITANGAGNTLEMGGLTLSASATPVTVTLAGTANIGVTGAIVNGTTPGNGLTVTATGTTTLSGNNTYTGVTTMNAAGGTLILSGNNSSATGGTTLTTGTLNINNANALSTGLLELSAVTGSAYGSSIINNTSGGALTFSGLSGVRWSGVSPAGIQFGTSASTSANDMDFGAGLVTAGTDRAMNIAGTGVTISMGTLTTSGTAASYTYKIDGAGNTLDLDGWRISGAASPAQAVQHKISGTANVNIGTIENGTGAFANGVGFNSDGVTRLTGNNTYTGATEFTGSGTNIISGNNSAAVGNVTIAGTSGSGKTPVVRLDNVNGISSSSSLFGASGNAQIGTLDLRAAGDFTLNSFGTVTKEGNSMIFTNSSGSQKTLVFTAANNYITTGDSGGKTLYNNSANLLLDFDGNIEIGGASAGGEATTFAGVGNFNVDSNLTDTGNGLTRALRKTGGGTLTLQGLANSIRGSTLVETGTLDLYGNLTASTGIVVSTSGTSANAGVRTASATINVRDGASLLNSSTTTVWSRGNLIVDGTAGAVVVENNGLVGGSGTVGAVTLKSGAFLTPGNSPGLLTASASSSWKSGSTYNWEINDAEGAAETNWDVFYVSGASGALDLSDLSGSRQMNLVLQSLSSGNLPSTNLANFSTSAEYTWVIAKAAIFTGIAEGTQDLTSYFNINTAAFNDGSVGNLPNGGFQVVTGTEGSLRTLNLMAIPEPSTGSMLGLGFAGLVVTRLLRRKIS